MTALTQASTVPEDWAAPAEVTAVETAGRCPILFLLGSSIAWLLASGVLSLITAIQVHTPSFMAACPILTYGRAQAMQETAFVYGWIGNAGLALTLWILGRLAGEPLRAPNWIVAGGVFWNLGIFLGLGGIAAGEGTSISLLQVPQGLQPFLLAAYATIGVAGVLAWAGRRRTTMFAAHWYAVAALFLFPWLFSVAQMMLLWAPVRGVLQAIVAGWFAQSLWTLWMAPLGLAGAYYVVPRITGKVMPAYELALFGFWCLLFVGGWTGGRHLIGGPVPVWIATIAIVMSVVLLFHYIIVAVNLRDAFLGRGTALKFIAFGLAAYTLGGVVDSITALRAVAVVTQFTFFDQAQQQLAQFGGVSMMLFGTLYFAVPRLTGRRWACGGLARGHLALMGLGIVLLVACLSVAGWIQGHDLNDPKVPFAEIASHTRPWLLGATAARAILLLGNMLLAVNFLQTAACCCCCRRKSEACA